jgi:hypothetical protein
VEEVVGDVTSRVDVKRAFQSTTHPIRGVIQGAVVYLVSDRFSPQKYINFCSFALTPSTGQTF